MIVEEKGRHGKSERERNKERQAGRQTGRQTGMQAGRQTDRQRPKQRDNDRGSSSSINVHRMEITSICSSSTDCKH